MTGFFMFILVLAFQSPLRAGAGPAAIPHVLAEPGLPRVVRSGGTTTNSEIQKHSA